jgi:hypothetical protein
MRKCCTAFQDPGVCHYNLLRMLTLTGIRGHTFNNLPAIELLNRPHSYLLNIYKEYIKK